MSEAELEALSEAVELEMAAALEFAKQSPEPDLGEVSRHVYVD
jgi:TPP-dependent pyruvate/acetoin dehydrogenase alpha subunit